MSKLLYTLREIDGKGVEHILQAPGKTTIGRARTNSIVVAAEITTVSKNHAVVELKQRADGFFDAWIEDLHTRNGSFVGQPSKFVIVQTKTILKLGDYIKLGSSPSQIYIYDVADQPTADQDITNDGSLSLSPDKSKSSNTFVDPSSNMSISINYPSGERASRQSVSIQIDPKLTGGAESYYDNSTLDPPKYSSERSILKNPGSPSMRPPTSRGSSDQSRGLKGDSSGSLTGFNQYGSMDGLSGSNMSYFYL